MSFNSNADPCYCGALDCYDCHPENFRNGRYIDDDEESDDGDIDTYEPGFDTCYDNPEDDYIALGYRDSPE